MANPPTLTTGLGKNVTSETAKASSQPVDVILDKTAGSAPHVAASSALAAPHFYPAWVGSFQIMKTIMEASLVSLPFAFALSGYVIGSLMLIISAAFTSYSCFLLACCAHKIGQGRVSFSALADLTYPWLGPVVDVLLLVLCAGGAITYVIIVGEEKLKAANISPSSAQ
jgi:hypothetical protein